MYPSESVVDVVLEDVRQWVKKEGDAKREENDDKAEGEDAKGELQQQVAEAFPGDRVEEVPAESLAIRRGWRAGGRSRWDLDTKPVDDKGPLQTGEPEPTGDGEAGGRPDSGEQSRPRPPVAITVTGKAK